MIDILFAPTLSPDRLSQSKKPRWLGIATFTVVKHSHKLQIHASLAKSKQCPIAHSLSREKGPLSREKGVDLHDVSINGYNSLIFCHYLNFF